MRLLEARPATSRPLQDDIAEANSALSRSAMLSAVSAPCDKVVASARSRAVRLSARVIAAQAFAGSSAPHNSPLAAIIEAPAIVQRSGTCAKKRYPNAEAVTS